MALANWFGRMKHFYSAFSNIAAGQRGISTNTTPLFIQASPEMWSEPLKKRRKLDPEMERKKAERTRRRLEKQIRILLHKGKKLKPVDEIEGTIALKRSQESRRRESVQHSFSEMETRIEVVKHYSVLKMRMEMREHKAVLLSIQAQKQALEELRAESETLYQHAVAVDKTIYGFHADGPVETMPSSKYVPPDGNYVDITNRFDKIN